MSKRMRKVMWHCMDSLAWILAGFKNPEPNPPTRLAMSPSQKQAGYAYRPVSEINRLTLSSGQMVLPGIGMPYEWK